MFCFSIEALPIGDDLRYSTSPKRALLGALGAHAADLDVLICCGDVLLSQLATRVSKVARTRSSSPFRATTVSSTHEFDLRLHRTLVWDLLDAVTSQRGKLDTDALGTALMRHDVFAVTASALDANRQADADRSMQAVPGYLGWFAADPGNPVQREIVSYLPRVAYLLHGVLVLDPFDTDSPFDPPPLDTHPEPWWDGLELTGVRYVAGEEYDDLNTLGKLPAAPVSERGAQTAAIIAIRTRPSHLERLSAALTADREGNGAWPFFIDTAVMPGAADAIVDRGKLAGYVLNPEHDTGKHKARLFRDLLGIEAGDWEFLAAQLKQGVAAAGELVRVRTDQYGVKYHVVVDVTGRNGEVHPVIAAWEVAQGRPPRLTTAYVTDASTPSDAPGVPLVVDPSLTGAERWEALYEIAVRAGQRAAATCVPTPMKVAGEWYPEGEFGGAMVTIKDARTGFARWLSTSGREQGYGTPRAGIIAPENVHDRARAYAEAVAEVLRLNDVSAEVRSYLT
jgi:hypothetical protein